MALKWNDRTLFPNVEAFFLASLYKMIFGIFIALILSFIYINPSYC